MCKKSKFDHTNKWYMHNPKSILENQIHELLRDFEIQTDHLILAGRPDLVMINNKNLLNRRLCHLGRTQSENKKANREICGAFNKFPDFFVQGFKIVVDSWKFTMLLQYILWDDWPIFMIQLQMNSYSRNWNTPD